MICRAKTSTRNEEVTNLTGLCYEVENTESDQVQGECTVYECEIVFYSYRERMMAHYGFC